MPESSERTITALSTPAGRGGLHIVRLCGPQALAIADKVFRPAGKKGRLLSEAPSHQAVLGKFVSPGGETIDECLALVMKAPHTFTGEDTVEFDCHGGMYIVRRILETLIAQGADMAEPGEFSKRAFLNGRMDLNEAEAVMDMIDAHTKYSLQAALSQLSGKLSEQIETLRQSLVHVIADIDVNLDYPEYDDLPEITDEVIQERCGQVLASVEKLLSTAESGRLLREGVGIALVGRPNVGKSSLMNRLLGTQRAIVTDVPGTTRDTLEEMVDFDGIACRLIDTAGIRDTKDQVEKIGVERAVSSLEEADLVLLVLDASAPVTTEDEELFGKACVKPHLTLLNKEDLAGPDEEVRRLADELKTRFSALSGKQEKVLPISAASGEGLDQLKDAVKEMFFTDEILSPDTALVTNLRQKQALIRCQEALERVRDASGMPQDLLVIDITEAADALGTITGKSAREEAVDEIFSRFCLGK